jgi:Protein kinase domain
VTPPPSGEGSKLGPYVVLRELARGGMGVVYEAYDPATSARYALKTLHREWLDDAEILLRFRREAEILAKLDHPHVVCIHAAEMSAGRPYLVQDLLPGGSLEARLSRGPLPVEEAVATAIKLAQGLACAHGLGVLHRDLKAENVLYDDRGEPRLVDFGLASAHDAQRLTQTGTIMGTPGTMAPEQVLGESGLDPRTDVYALGVLLYTMLATAPFPGTAPLAVLEAVLQTEPRPLRELRPEVPAWLEAVVRRAMSKAREDRFADMDELIRALLAGDRNQALAPSRAWVGLVASAVAALVLAGVAVWASSRREPPDAVVADEPPPPAAPVETPAGHQAEVERALAADRISDALGLAQAACERFPGDAALRRLRGGCALVAAGGLDLDGARWLAPLGRRVLLARAERDLIDDEDLQRVLQAETQVPAMRAALYVTSRNIDTLWTGESAWITHPLERTREWVGLARGLERAGPPPLRRHLGRRVQQRVGELLVLLHKSGLLDEGTAPADELLEQAMDLASPAHADLEAARIRLLYMRGNVAPENSEERAALAADLLAALRGLDPSRGPMSTRAARVVWALRCVRELSMDRSLAALAALDQPPRFPGIRQITPLESDLLNHALWEQMLTLRIVAFQELLEGRPERVTQLARRALPFLAGWYEQGRLSSQSLLTAAQLQLLAGDPAAALEAIQWSTTRAIRPHAAVPIEDLARALLHAECLLQGAVHTAPRVRDDLDQLLVDGHLATGFRETWLLRAVARWLLGDEAGALEDLRHAEGHPPLVAADTQTLPWRSVEATRAELEGKPGPLRLLWDLAEN